MLGNCDNPNCTAHGNNRNNNNNNNQGMTNVNVNNDNDASENNDNGNTRNNDTGNNDGDNNSNNSGMQLNNSNNSNRNNNNNDNDSGCHGLNVFMINENHSCNDNSIKNENDDFMKDAEHCEKTPENLKWWILINSAMTTSMETNEESFHGIEVAENPMGMVSDKDKLDSNLTAEMNNIGHMPFNEDSIANLFRMNNLMKRGF